VSPAAASSAVMRVRPLLTHANLVTPSMQGLTLYSFAFPLNLSLLLPFQLNLS